jgi:hypothetical protein
MKPSAAKKQTIEGIPAERYKERLKDERAKLRRHYCTVFRFWSSCRYKPCKNARACLGDALACLKRNEQTVTRDEQWKARQQILETTSEKEGPERAARECMPSELYRQS